MVRNRQMGCKKGVPDLCLPVPMGKYHGLFIEMKKPGGIASDSQRRWNASLNALGYKAVYCYGWEDAKNVLLGYMAQTDSGEQAHGISEITDGWDDNGSESSL